METLFFGIRLSCFFCRIWLFQNLYFLNLTVLMFFFPKYFLEFLFLKYVLSRSFFLCGSYLLAPMLRLFTWMIVLVSGALKQFLVATIRVFRTLSIDTWTYTYIYTYSLQPLEYRNISWLNTIFTCFNNL